MSREIRSFVYGREYIPTGLAESETCRLLIVTDDQIEILRTLVNYAHRRNSWNDGALGSDRYYLPSDEDWDLLEATVDDLEDKLMSQCDFVTLDDVNDRLGINNVTPAITLDVQATEQSIARFQYTDGHGLIVSSTNPELSASDVAIIDAPHIALMDHDLEVLTVLGASGGRVGIGTVVPIYSVQVTSGDSAISPVIASENDAGVMALFFCGRSGGVQPGHAVIQADTGHKVRLIGTAGTEIVSGFGCNGKTPQIAAAVNAACTDLPTVIALCNQLRAALVANGICS